MVSMTDSLPSKERADLKGVRLNMAKVKVVICPYCGDTQAVGERCRACGGFFEPLSRQATHNAMGPWFVRDESKPFQPGASYETILKLIQRGLITKYSIIRGPTTKQFWTVARRVPGLSHVLGYCHNCDASVDAGDHGCHACGVPFGAYLDRNFLGLPDVHAMPWEAESQEIEMQSAGRGMDFRRAAEPLGISSFASDDELRNAGVPPVTSATPYVPTPASHTNPGGAGREQSIGTHFPMQSGHSSTPSVSGNTSESSDSSVANRAAHRRLMQQQQTIRMLFVAVFILAALVIIGFAAWLGARRETIPPTSPSSTAPAAEVEHAATASASTAPADGHVGPAPSNEQKKPASTAPEDIAHRQQELDRALSLIAAAEDATRARPDRIADYEQALASLKKLQASSDELPDDLAATISDAERAMERLKLEEFFP
jgi:hypothetical protein